MSWTLLRGTLHQRRASIFWFCIGLVLYSWLMTWFYPKIGGGRYAEMIQSLPPEVLVIFGGTEVPFASLGGYFQTEYLGLMWMIIVAAAVVLFAGRAFSGEVGAGTMELLLAQPISRLQLALTRVAAFVGYTVVLSAASFVPIQAFGPAYGIELGAKTFWTLFAFGTLFMLAVGGLAMLLSAVFRDSGRPSGIAAGLLVVFWIADLVSSVSKAARFFDPINLVSYWQPGKIINGESISPRAWWIYGLVGALSLAAAVVLFRRRDVA
ncbi:MAG: ABC transporter permease subunit [Gaiellales bacterium]|nr:ABC transporter permease subunit [Gaiellales bacterium]